MGKFINDLKKIQNEMIKLVGEVNNLTNVGSFNKLVNETWTPKCDIFETEEKFYIIVDLAGIKKENINVITSDNYLKIQGERNFEIESHNICYYNMEIDTGKFERIIEYPDTKIDKKKPLKKKEKGFSKNNF